MRLAIEHNRQTLLLYHTADRSYKVWFPQLLSFNKFKFSERLGFLMVWLSLNHESHKDLTVTSVHLETELGFHDTLTGMKTHIMKQKDIDRQT